MSSRSSVVRKRIAWIVQQRFVHIRVINLKRPGEDRPPLNKDIILRTIKRKERIFPVRALIPVAEEVVRARKSLVHGVSKLLRFIPLKVCRYCSEIFVGNVGHCIRTCRGPMSLSRTFMHEWVDGGINDIIVPVEAYHLDYMFQNAIIHREKLNYDRIPAVLELCIQAGIKYPDRWIEDAKRCKTSKSATHQEQSYPTYTKLYESAESANSLQPPSLSTEELCNFAEKTLRAWEAMRRGTNKLILRYPVKVCKHCPEVHVGPTGHKVLMCGVFKNQKWRGQHYWKWAEVDDLIRPRYVWHPRPHDPTPLKNEGRRLYGKAPAVVEMCIQAGAAIPHQYYDRMRINGYLERDCDGL